MRWKIHTIVRVGVLPVVVGCIFAMILLAGD